MVISHATLLSRTKSTNCGKKINCTLGIKGQVQQCPRIPVASEIWHRVLIIGHDLAGSQLLKTPGEAPVQKQLDQGSLGL